MPVTSMIRVALLAAAIALNSCSTNPVTGGANFVTMSEAQEVQVGRTEDAKVKEVIDEAAHFTGAAADNAGEDFLRKVDRLVYCRIAVGQLGSVRH